MKQFKQMVAQSERGQAIVLIALFMVVMLAMVGVAIDGGGLFWLWRNAQNAADTAALQAAYDRCTGATDAEWVAQGFEAAEINGFNNDGVNNTVTVDLYTHPNDGVEYVRVLIEAVKPKYFIQLVYRGPLEVKAQSLVYCSGAVDFSNLPGMIGLGGCTCSGNSDWNNSIDFAGANYEVYGDIHSNCKVDITPGGGNNGGVVEGDVGGSAGIDADPGRVDITGEEDPAAEVVEMPAEIPLNLYFPGGEIYDGILLEHGANYVEHVVGDVNFTQADYMEGLWAVEGDVKLAANLDGNFGPRGFTVVATGVIEISKFDFGNGAHLDNWYYYGHNVENTGDEGVTRRWSRGNGSAIAMYSALDTREACNASDIGIKLGNSNEGGVDWDVVGLIYAPNTIVSWSGQNIGVWGPVIAYRLNSSGSELLWRHNPSFLQPMAPVMNNAE